MAINKDSKVYREDMGKRAAFYERVMDIAAKQLETLIKSDGILPEVISEWVHIFSSAEKSAYMVKYDRGSNLEQEQISEIWTLKNLLLDDKVSFADFKEAFMEAFDEFGKPNLDDE